jgi:hypothetical protein
MDRSYLTANVATIVCKRLTVYWNAEKIRAIAAVKEEQP